MELDSLYRMLEVVGHFLDQHLPGGGPRISLVLSEAHEASNLRGLRMVRGDLITMLQACTLTERGELDGELRAQLGISLESLFDRQRVRVAKLRERGRLTSEEQYYLVREHLELVAMDPDRELEREDLQRMLDEYGERVAARANVRKHRDGAG